MNEDTLEKLGVKIGHYTDSRNLTGTTVFLSERGADIGIDIRGSNTGTLNIAAYDAKAVGKLAHAVVLTGGSTYGLESAFGVMQYLEEKQIGNHTRAALIPGITGAVIYDLAVGSSHVRPGKQEGYRAAENASYENLGQGNVGVGTGATTGKWFKGRKLKGGFGMATTRLPHDILVSAFVVTNAVGDVLNPSTGNFYAETGDYDLAKKSITEDITQLTGLANLIPTNTTLAVLATNVALEKTQLMKIAELAHDGMARAIFPVHTTMDGDIVFALSSRSGERKQFPSMPTISLIDTIGIAGQDALMKAIKNSIVHARSIKDLPAYSQ